jgi:hypothetical protein
MSIFHTSSLAASRTFCPFLPMASESCESSTITSMCFSIGSMMLTRLFWRGSLARYLEEKGKMAKEVALVEITGESSEDRKSESFHCCSFVSSGRIRTYNASFRRQIRKLRLAAS